jgi:predicted chitinase
MDHMQTIDDVSTTKFIKKINGGTNGLADRIDKQMNTIN